MPRARRAGLAGRAGDAACTTFGTTTMFSWQVCPGPIDSIVVSGTLNTDTGCIGANRAIVSVTGGSACVIYAGHIDVTAGGILAQGNRPLVIAADTLSIAGGIEVSGQFGAIGAGTDFNCSAATSSDNTGAGGPGGSSGFSGGAGGAGGTTPAAPPARAARAVGSAAAVAAVPAA